MATKTDGLNVTDVPFVYSTLRQGRPFLRQASSSTLSPGHAAILEMHANSQSNAIIYVAVVLGLYVLVMSIFVIKYIRTERYEARLTRLFQNIVQRDRFFRMSRRRSSVPKDLPLSPVIPDITETTPSPTPDSEEESKV